MFRLASLLLIATACTPPPAPTFTEGGSCAYAGDAHCETGLPRLLECRDGTWQPLADCRGPDACVDGDQSTACDTSGNTVGDRCLPLSEGKVRCDPVGQRRIIRCVNGRYEVAIDCPQFTRCGLDPDAGLICG